MPIIIADVGNCHEGDYNSARMLLKSAIRWGAGEAKFQAGDAKGFARSPEEIKKYEKYCLSIDEYLELGTTDFLDEWAGFPKSFCSVFGGKEFDQLRVLNGKMKIAARQYNEEFLKKYKKFIEKSETLYISIPHDMPLAMVKALWPGKGIPFHCVTEYPARDGMLNRINDLRETLGVKEIGYSDHTIGIGNCVQAVWSYRVTHIEKHFTFSHDTDGIRDHVHAADPYELAMLRNAIRDRTTEEL